MDMPMDMQHQAMGYDRTATMFSPEGHLLQVEYAEKTVRLGPSSIGIVCNDGVLILADKRIDDKLVVPKSTSKIHEIDEHLITSVAGIVSDARVLVEKAQVLAQQNKITYNSPIEPELLIKEISNIKQQFSQYGGARPFGVSLMVAGINNLTPELFVSDVTGNYMGYFATAIGENDDLIKDKLRESYKKDINLKEATKLAVKILKEIQEEKFNIDRYELVIIPKKTKKLEKIDGKGIEEF